MSCKCSNFEQPIPTELHTVDKVTDSSFENTESVYRRFPFLDENGYTNILSNGELSINIFSVRAMSCNRDKYSQPSDTLFNTKDGDHYINDGVVELSVEKLREFDEPHPDDPSIRYNLALVHSPEECMYPHMEVIATKAGVLVRDLRKPNNIKFSMKAFFSRIGKVVIQPTK